MWTLSFVWIHGFLWIHGFYESMVFYESLWIHVSLYVFVNLWKIVFLCIQPFLWIRPFFGHLGLSMNSRFSWIHREFKRIFELNILNSCRHLVKKLLIITILPWEAFSVLFLPPYSLGSYCDQYPDQKLNLCKTIFAVGLTPGRAAGHSMHEKKSNLGLLLVSSSRKMTVPL